MLDYRKWNLRSASKFFPLNNACFWCMIVCSIVSHTLLTAEPFLIQHVLTEHCTRTESEEWNFFMVYKKVREIQI